MLTIFTKNETKSRLNVFNSFAFNFGSIAAILPFMFWTPWLLANWQWVSSGFASLAIVILILYIFLGEDIKLDNLKDEKDKNVSFKSVIKEKNTWIFSIVYIFLLTAVVAALTMVPSKFIAAENSWWSGTDWATPLWKILFLLGIVPGAYTVGLFGKSKMARKPNIIGSLIVGILTMLISVIIGALCNDSVVGIVFCMIFILISGTFLWGIQGVLLGMTYFYQNATPKKQGILLGFIWGIGYMGFTFTTIILTLPLNSDHLIIFIILFFFLSFLAPVLFLFVPETHGLNSNQLDTNEDSSKDNNINQPKIDDKVNLNRATKKNNHQGKTNSS